jgi:putative tricarboxylic transport membrane protein
MQAQQPVDSEHGHLGSRPWQTAVALAVLAAGVLLAAGAVGIRSEAGYSGVGPNFLPWVVAALMTACGALLLWQARGAGFRAFADAPGTAQGHWPGFAWVSAGILLNAALITTAGFILSCALCFMLAARGFRSAEGQRGRGLGGLLLDGLLGVAIAAPVYWMFTKALAINLPGLTGTGWL